MGGLFAQIAFWAVASLLIYGGVQTSRDGFKIHQGWVITGPAGKTIGILLIIAGIGLGLGASIWLELMTGDLPKIDPATLR